MSGYRRVNYYELCRLCVSSEGAKMHIFREEGRRRQLPSKIQMCLPLQVQEDDSLPKIICNQCVEKLESFFDFRKSCVNAEAMLESYFTSSRYSPEFIREGKVYVKAESPPKKKSQAEEALKVPNVSGPVSVDSISSLVQAGSIQIISPAESEPPRLSQYKCTLDMQPNSMAQVVESPSVSYAYHTNTNVATTNTSPGVTLLKTEDSTQTDNHRSENTHIHDHMDQGTTTYYVRVPNTVENSSPGHSENSEVVEGETIHQTITFAPNHGQDMLVHFGFNNKDNKDQNNTATIIRTDERESIAQIGEFLRMKTVVVEEEVADSSMCDQCGKHLETAEQQANHAMNCSAHDNKDAAGHYACDICGKPFKRKEHLFQHRKLHTGERPYSCTTCGKSFSRKEHLVRHSVSHTGQKTHACDMCSKSFSRKDNLRKHRKTHGIAGPYVCEICHKSFVVKHYYLMHKATHATSETPEEPIEAPPFRCDVCHKGFSTKQYLISHKMLHNRKSVVNGDNTSGQEHQSHSESDEPQEAITLSTVNAAAILPPNVIHNGTTTPVFQVTSGNTTYLATAATTQMLENYRRLHASS
ncbi:zinc finger protein 629-like isoform X2 [Macrosteles quadrilineatus]|uniref:zinc finger protein 629-like isoform X2 n=1 Tax=Macrosteles quadrilineatus TaxID=74068 RepID=UPI0023E281D8|nr:zinc finger protein 629-like isoform X2 [Macrosteles quadrilineatus]